MNDAEHSEFSAHAPAGGLHPQTVFGTSVGIALLISAPTWLAAARGGADPLSAGIRFLIGIAVVWACLFTLNAMLGAFVAQADTKAAAIAHEIETERRAQEMQATLEAAAHDAAALEQPAN